jgi:hypothetical protein
MGSYGPVWYGMARCGAVRMAMVWGLSCRTCMRLAPKAAGQRLLPKDPPCLWCQGVLWACMCGPVLLLHLTRTPLHCPCLILLRSDHTQPLCCCRPGFQQASLVPPPAPPHYVKVQLVVLPVLSLVVGPSTACSCFVAACVCMLWGPDALHACTGIPWR